MKLLYFLNIKDKQVNKNLGIFFENKIFENCRYIYIYFEMKIKNN